MTPGFLLTIDQHVSPKSCMVSEYFQHVGIGCSNLNPKRRNTIIPFKPTSISCRSRGDPSNRRGTKRSWSKGMVAICSLHLKGNTWNILELGKENLQLLNSICARLLVSDFCCSGGIFWCINFQPSQVGGVSGVVVKKPFWSYSLYRNISFPLSFLS